MDAFGYPALDEQEKILKESSNSVKKNAYFMRKAMDEDNLREALRYSAAMLGELRTSQLSPQKYYELYMQVFDELANLEAFFSEERSKGRTYAELYELVQHAGNVLPRLYLMVAVGALYIRSGEAPAKDILKDLVEMCKGVQHPTRGLFLRSYLCQRSRGLLPDVGSDYEGQGGDIHDALDFLLSNFIEMNKLWVRMQHQGSVKDKEKREKERQQLQDLVGRNLTYLSQLDGLDFLQYSGHVLPRMLEQIVSCKDDIAQQYLMQCIIQGFPDAFHLGTLDALLGALPDLQSGVKLHNVMASLMDRLARYAASDSSSMTRLLEGNAFQKFKDAIHRVTELHTDIMAADVIEMYIALMNYTEKVHPGDLNNVNQVLGACQAALVSRGLGNDTKAERQLVNLLSMPINSHSVVTVLTLTEYPPLMAQLQSRTYKEMAVKIINVMQQNQTVISTVDQVQMLFQFIEPLVEEPVAIEDMDDEDIEDEQMLVARMLHLLHADDVVEHFQIIKTARNHLQKGGPVRIKHSFPALIFCTLQNIRKISSGAQVTDDGTTMEVMLQWCLELCLVVSEVPDAMQAIRLMLACAHVASEEAGLEMLAYEFFEQAFTLYEESVADSKQKIIALQGIIGTLHQCYIFSEENRDALVQSATSYSAKLFKRSDQCRAVCSCSHLYWQDQQQQPQGESTSTEGPQKQPPVRDPLKVMNCLKRAIKVANAAKQQVLASARPKDAHHVTLYVEILNHYLYYLDQGNEHMTPSVVQQFLELVRDEIAHNKDKLPPETVKFWANTLAHIEYQKAKDGDGKQRFLALVTEGKDPPSSP